MSRIIHGILKLNNNTVHALGSTVLIVAHVNISLKTILKKINSSQKPSAQCILMCCGALSGQLVLFAPGSIIWTHVFNFILQFEAPGHWLY